MSFYNHKEIEPKWQKYWADHHTFKTGTDASKPKFYALDMFPYPSGAGLHVGHPEGYTATDILSRFKRAQGYNVGFFHTITIYLEVGTCLSRHTRVATTQDHLCFAELRIFLQVLTHLVADLFKADVTISRIDQTDIERNDVGTIVLHRGPGIV